MTIVDTISTRLPAATSDQTSSTDHHGRDRQGDIVGAAPLPINGHRTLDTHGLRAVDGPSTGRDHSSPDHQSGNVESGPSSAPAATSLVSTPSGLTSRRDADLLLYLFADQLDDVESLRIATENRLRSLFSDEEWGKGVSADLPEAQAITAQLEAIKAVEHQVTLSLKRAMRAHYLGPWCKRTLGVGEKQLGRLLASIGDPGERERPSQLRSYCGLGDPDRQVRRKGVQANWSTEAKTRTYLVAEACVKAGVRKLPHCDDDDGYDVAGRKAITPYGQTYLDGRTKYADATHRDACKRCGPSGNPAEAGTPLSLGHQHARAMRLVMKRILLDLWKEAR